MADYYVILKRAVSGLPDGSRDKRQAVYDKARKALLAQLQSMDPPLAPSEISKQRMALEEAVRTVERDLDQEKTEAEAASAVADVVSSEVAPPKDEAESSSEAPDVVAEKSEDTKSESVSTSKESSSAQESAASDQLVRRAGKDVLKNAVRDANALGAATNAAVKSAQDAADAVGEQRDGDVSRIEPTLGDTVVSSARTYSRPADPQLGASDVKASDPLGEDEAPRGRFGLVAGLLLTAGVLGGTGYLVYENRGSLLGSEDGSAETKNVAESQTETEGDVPLKDSSGEADIPAKPVRTVTVQPPVEDSGTSSETPTGDVAPPADDAGVGEVSRTSEPEVPAQTESETTAEPAVQQSILYEEEGPNGEPGAAIPGNVTWSLEGEGTGAVVVMSAQIPDQSLTIDIRISKNADPELPASHLIEIAAIRANVDEARAITNIPGLILKPTEQSRGEGLVGAAIRISDDLHWIALTAGEKEIAYNLELLLLRSWIDIPIQYSTGRRAILTLEKGKKGDQVIEAAIKAWEG